MYERKIKFHEICYCEQCGKVFREKGDSANRFCSHACDRRSRGYKDVAVPVIGVCLVCGKEFTDSRKGAGVQRFCSKKCYGLTRSMAITPMSCRVWFNKCAVCGKVFTGRTENAKYCCSSCRREAHHIGKDQPECVCSGCGITFKPDHWGRTTFCSSGCSKRAYKSKRKAQRRFNGKCETFDPIAVLARDRWRCMLCGRKTMKSKRGTTHPLAPELDHIIPLSKGGEHTKANTQCACRECNGKKSSSLMGQLRVW